MSPLSIGSAGCYFLLHLMVCINEMAQKIHIPHRTVFYRKDVDGSSRRTFEIQIRRLTFLGHPHFTVWPWVKI